MRARRISNLAPFSLKKQTAYFADITDQPYFVYSKNYNKVIFAKLKRFPVNLD